MPVIGVICPVSVSGGKVDSISFIGVVPSKGVLRDVSWSPANIDPFTVAV